MEQTEPANGGIVLVMYLLIGAAFVFGFILGAAVVGLLWWMGGR